MSKAYMVTVPLNDLKELKIRDKIFQEISKILEKVEVTSNNVQIDPNITTVAQAQSAAMSYVTLSEREMSDLLVKLKQVVRSNDYEW